MAKRSERFTETPDEAYERGHEEGFNAGYAASGEDGTRQEGAHTGTLQAGRSGAVMGQRAVHMEILQRIGGRSAEVEIRRGGPMMQLEFQVRADSPRDLIQLVGFLSTTFAEMENNIRRDLAAGKTGESPVATVPGAQHVHIGTLPPLASMTKP